LGRSERFEEGEQAVVRQEAGSLAALGLGQLP
jgi:hypothetical protein